MSDEEWRENALCKGKETNFFYPEVNVKGGKKQVQDVKAICRLCQVSSECLTYAINNREEFGIWGGLTPKERFKVTKQYSIMTKEVATVFVKRYVNVQI